MTCWVPSTSGTFEATKRPPDTLAGTPPTVTERRCGSTTVPVTVTNGEPVTGSAGTSIETTGASVSTVTKTPADDPALPAVSVARATSVVSPSGSVTDAVNAPCATAAATPFTVTPARCGSAAVPTTITVEAASGAFGAGLVIVTVGACVSRATVKGAESAAWARASVARATMTLSPSASGTAAATKWPAETIAGTPFTVTPARCGSVAVPDDRERRSVRERGEARRVERDGRRERVQRDDDGRRQVGPRGRIHGFGHETVVAFGERHSGGGEALARQSRRDAADAHAREVRHVGNTGDDRRGGPRQGPGRRRSDPHVRRADVEGNGDRRGAAGSPGPVSRDCNEVRGAGRNRDRRREAIAGDRGEDAVHRDVNEVRLDKRARDGDRRGGDHGARCGAVDRDGRRRRCLRRTPRRPSSSRRRSTRPR